MKAGSTMGEQRRFRSGETIYAQGDASKGVYMILDGQVDIWRTDGEDSQHIATLRDGELLGEVSTIERQPHSVTAKATHLTTVMFITASAFRKSFADPLVRHVVNTLAARLRSSYAAHASLPDQGMDQRNGQNTGQNTGQPAAGPVTFQSRKYATIEGSSRMVADKMLTFAEIKDCPFTVGNIATPDGHAVVSDAALRLPLRNAPELADNHFEIIRRDGQLWVRDLGSVHGTMVNGNKLSKYALDATARLRVGKNTIVAGGPDSPVRLLVKVPPEAEQTD
jgi:CRP-like cAMP-binding protein